MFETIRNMFRRKVRTALTVFGIVIGVLALVVLGSLAEKMNLMMEGGEKFLTGQITVQPKGGDTGRPFSSSGFLTQKQIKEIEKVEGVKAVQAGVSALYIEPSKDDGPSMSFGMPPTITGSDLTSDFENLNWKSLQLKSGRLIEEGENKVVTIGFDIANEKELTTGDTFTILEKDFEVVGVLDQTMTGPDSMILMDIDDAREIVIKQNPTLAAVQEKAESAKKTLKDPAFQYLSPEAQKEIKKAATFKKSNIISDASVSWEDNTDPEELAAKIEEEVKGVSTLSPAEGKEIIKQATLILNAVIIGSALIALIVGSLSVINTMIMSVSERKREIGVKKAVGAKNKHIIKEYLTESALIGFLGGIVGLGIGYLIVLIINNITEESNIQIFQVTPRLAIGAVIFSIVLGAVAGLYPAWHAAKIDPVIALKDE